MDISREKELNNLLKGYSLLLYFSGSMIMNEPTDECILDFWSNDILKKLPVRSTNPRFVKAASQLRNICKDKNLCLKAIQSDYNRLFTDNGNMLVPVCESFYINGDGSDTGKRNENVTEFFESYGWHSIHRGKKADDHLGTEVLFLITIIEKLISFDDQACKTEMKNEIRRFLDNHIFTWVPDWSDRVQKYSETIYFKSVATLILACAEDIYNLCSINKFSLPFPN
jgi:TorA-specific chaperone